MKNYEYIFLDLDGTLSDSAPGIVNSAIYALGEMGIKDDNREDLKKFVGPPLAESFSKFYNFNEDKVQEAIKIFRSYYREKGIFENDMYEGIEDMLKALKDSGKTLVVATSKPEEFARQIIDRYGISHYFHFIAGSLTDETRTQKHEVIEYAMESCGIKDPDKILMVGDRRHDVLGSAKFGIDCMGVLYGYGTREELLEAGAKYIAENVSDVSHMILG